MDSLSYDASMPSLENFSLALKRENTITILGSSRSTKEIETELQVCKEITESLVQSGYNILTGCGNDGIMGESYGAALKNSKIENGKPVQNLAIIREPLWGDENLDGCVVIDKAASEGERLEKFCKVSNTFILFPGGATTMQEAATLIQHNEYCKIEEPLTVILFGSEYWKGLTLQYETLFNAGLLSKKPIGNLFYVVDSKEDLMKIINPRHS